VVAVSFVGTLALLIGTYTQIEVASELELSLIFAAGSGVLALIGGLMLGRESAPEIFGQTPRAKDWGWAVAVGLAGFAIAWIYAEGLNALLASILEEDEVPVEESVSLPALLFSVAILAPFTEELLDRGVAWAALARLGSVRQTILLTAMLFALSHGLNGGGLFELPHRFAGGLLLGWLRHTSGSLAPCILAHVTWNAVAVLLGG
jgi:membrane protease YdiL (CAAX protease family)